MKDMTIKSRISNLRNSLFPYRNILFLLFIIVIFHNSWIELLDKYIIPIASQIPNNNLTIASCFFLFSSLVCCFSYNHLYKANYLISQTLLAEILILCIFLFLKHYYHYEFYEYWNIDYVWISLTPFFFAEIQRIVKVNKRKFQKRSVNDNSSNCYFLDDSPCDDDSLVTERGVYAEHLIQHIFGTYKSYKKQDAKSNPFIGNGAFVINICEEYGYGKTSFFALVHNKLKRDWTDQYISFKYQPWLCESESTMVTELFNRFREELSPYAPQIKKDIANYIRTLLDKSDNAFVHFFKTVFCQSPSMHDEREKLKETIAKLEKTIIVFIDDVDRLQKEELLTLLNLVRDTADFQNVFYIMAADKVHLTNCLEDCGISNPDKYLKKIIDYEFMLPANDGLVMTYLQEKLTSVLGKYVKEEKEVNKNVFSIINHENIESVFANVRDIKRILNDYIVTLAVIKSGLKEEIDYKDLFLLTIIKSLRPDVYKSLRDNDEQLLCLLNNDIYIFKYADIHNEKLLATIEAAGKRANANNYDAAKEKKCNTINEMMVDARISNDEFVADSLRYLFNSQRSPGDEINIKHKESYYRYFSGQLRKNQLSSLEVEQILCCDEERFQEQIKRILKENKIDSYITRMTEWSKKWKNSPILFVRKVYLFVKHDFPIEYKAAHGLDKWDYEDTIYYQHRLRYSQILYGLYKEDNKKAIDDNEKKLLHEFIMEDDHYAFSAITLNTLHGWLPHKLSIGFEELNSWRQELTNQFVCKYFNNNPYLLEDEILDVIPLLRGSFAKSPWDKTFANYLNNTSDYILWFEKMVVYQNGKFLWNNKYMRQFNFTLGGYLIDLIRECSPCIQHDERIKDLMNLIRHSQLENENPKDHPYLLYIKSKYESIESVK